MRAIKYLIVGLLIISVTKKTYLSDSNASLNQNLPFKFTLSPKDAQAAIDALGKPEAQSMTGLYDPITKTATITFTNVVEYSKSVTPPNIVNRKLKLFGSLPTKTQDQKGALMLRGGLRPTTTLYGIIQKHEFNSSSSSSASSNDSSLQHYDAASKTALLKNGQTYVGIVEYNQTVTPPNIANPALQNFATIATPQYVPSSMRLSGGIGPQTTLYGIPVSGESISVKTGSSTSGFYWPDSKIVQLNNGETFVCVIQQKQGKYKKKGGYATGPVWTWFSDDKQLDEELTAFGISTKTTDFKQRVETIGTAKLNHATNVLLYGVLMTLKNQFPTTQTASNPFIPRRTMRHDMPPYDAGYDASLREKTDIVLNSITNSIASAAAFATMRSSMRS